MRSRARRSTSEAIKLVAAALEAHTLENIASRQDREKCRQATYRSIEAAGKVAGEIEAAP